LASTFRGDELRDSYRIGGRGVLRLITSDGNFDYEMVLDLTVEDIPF